jgi:glycosyltransferase involved in cell wall biosynthesis
MTRVSVVIPTRNRPALLACTLRSVLAQRAIELEPIVVDDGSCPPVAPLDDPRLRLLRHDQPRGVSAARNSGIAVATGHWIAFCDDDDVWAPDKLSAQLQAAAETAASWVYTGTIAVDQHLRILGGGPPPPPAQVLAELGRYNSVPGSASSVLVTASLLAEVGGFDTSLRRTEDWDLWLRLAQRAAPAGVPRPLVAIRQHADNIIVDRESLLRDQAVLARRYGLKIDPLSARRRAAWGLLRAGHRLAAAREYLGIAMRGDFRSIGRAIVALLHPAVGSDQLMLLSLGQRMHCGWSLQARAWLDPLTQRCAS